VRAAAPPPAKREPLPIACPLSCPRRLSIGRRWRRGRGGLARPDARAFTPFMANKFWANAVEAPRAVRAGLSLCAPFPKRQAGVCSPSPFFLLLFFSTASSCSVFAPSPAAGGLPQVSASARPDGQASARVVGPGLLIGRRAGWAPRGGPSFWRRAPARVRARLSFFLLSLSHRSRSFHPIPSRPPPGRHGLFGHDRVLIRLAGHTLGSP